MIGYSMSVVDIDPAGFSSFSETFAGISPSRPQAVLWHEDGMARKLLLEVRETTPGTFRIRDARSTARATYDNLAPRVRRVIVTDKAGLARLRAAANILPDPEETLYEYRGRVNQALSEQFDESTAIYPAPTLDRGPVAFDRMEEFAAEQVPDGACLVLGVFGRESLDFSLVARLAGGMAELVTSFDHWPGMTGWAELSVAGLDRAVLEVESTLGPVVSALFIRRGGFDRLFDGRRHDSLPGYLLRNGQAFGYSSLGGLTEDALLHTAGFFAYAPVYVS